MTRTVWKFSINPSVDGINPILHIPKDAEFLTLRLQEYNTQYMLNTPDPIILDTWWLVESDNDVELVQLYVRGTGDEIPQDGIYLGTVLRSGFVFHIWRKPIRQPESYTKNSARSQ